MKLEEVLLKIRKLAKTSHWQSIYGAAKEINLKMFNNIINFTSLQIYFLNYLSSYNSLFTDIVMGEIEEKVLENNIYEDAYFYYRQKRTYKNNLKSGLEDKDAPNTEKNTQWIFKKPKKKVI